MYRKWTLSGIYKYIHGSTARSCLQSKIPFTIYIENKRTLFASFLFHYLFFLGCMWIISCEQKLVRMYFSCRNSLCLTKHINFMQYLALRTHYMLDIVCVYVDKMSRFRIRLNHSFQSPKFVNLLTQFNHTNQAFHRSPPPNQQINWKEIRMVSMYKQRFSHRTQTFATN